MTNEITQLSPIQRGWLGLADLRVKLTDELTGLSLAAQKILLTEAVSITEREQQLKDHSKAVKAITDARLNSTLLQKIKTLQEDLMKYEKEAANNPMVAELQAELLKLKKEEANRTALTNARNLELSQFKAHVTNELNRLVMQLRADCWNEINVMYKQALSTNDRNLEVAVCETINNRIPLAKTRIFESRYITDEDKAAVKKQIPIPNFNGIRGEMVQECVRIFSNFESDLAAGTMPEQTQAEELQAEFDLSKAITEIASEVIPEVQAEGRAIKKLRQVEVFETQQWAKIVSTYFDVHGWHYLKARAKWSTLTIAQMAEALGKYCTENNIYNLEGLTLKEVEKL